jgi:hypothetical protein
MADIYKRLVTGVPAQVGVGNTTVYTCPVATSAVVKKISIVNTSGVDATIKINHVPNAGAVGATNVVLNTATIVAGGGATDDDAIILLSAGDFISCIASAAASITVILYGIEST